MEIAIALVVIGLAIGFVPRWFARQRLNAQASAEAAPTVDVTSPVAAQADLGTPLPADVQPFIEAAIHARASGYLKNWFVDIGEHVTNNQTLADRFDTPELDQQLAQARADLDRSHRCARPGQNHLGPLDGPAQNRQRERTGNGGEKKSDYVLKQGDIEFDPRQRGPAGGFKEV